MMNYGNENLEFERINAKLDFIFDILHNLADDADRERFNKELKEKEVKAENTARELEWHKENRQFLEESRKYRRQGWDRINDIHRNMKGENLSLPIERQDVPGGF